MTYKGYQQIFFFFALINSVHHCFFACVMEHDCTTFCTVMEFVLFKKNVIVYMYIQFFADVYA